MQPGIEFVLPPREKRTDILTSLRTQALYQVMYYAELMSFSNYFENRYMELERIWDQVIGTLKKRGRSDFMIIFEIYNRNKREDQFNPIYRYADVDRSEHENRFGNINITAINVRLLDNQNQPRLAIITSSSPQFKSKYLIKKTENEYQFPGYRLLNTLVTRDENLQEIDHQSKYIPGSFADAGVFMLEHHAAHDHYTFALEAYLNQTNELLAIGRTSFDSPTPLVSNPNSLELSDLILGVRYSETSDYPFPVLPAHEFERTALMNVYFEIYHLTPDENGISHYTIEIGIIKLDKKGRKKKGEQQISMIYDLENFSKISKEIYEIDISKLSPGRYEFFVKIKDKRSGQERYRRIEFAVIG